MSDQTIPDQPDDIEAGSCDWGHCDNEGVTHRWSPEHGWLPVCEQHRTGRPNTRWRRTDQVRELEHRGQVAGMLATKCSAMEVEEERLVHEAQAIDDLFGVRPRALGSRPRSWATTRPRSGWRRCRWWRRVWPR